MTSLLYIDDPKEGEAFPRKPVRLSDKSPSSRCLRKGRPWTFWPAIIIAALTLSYASISTYKHGFGIIHWTQTNSPGGSISCPTAASLPYKAGQLKWNFNIAQGTKDATFAFIQDQKRDFDPKDPTGFDQRIRVAGAIFVQKAPARGSPFVSVDLDVKLSHPELADSIHILAESDGLQFLTATFVDGLPRNAAPSICVIGTVTVDAETSMHGFDLKTIGLPVQFSKSLTLVADTVKVNTISGRVSTEGTLDSESIEIETVSAPITGTYPLANLLSLKTVSGSIYTTITPTEGDKDHHGEFVVSTKSGTVRVMTDVNHIPKDREYTTSVTGGSGSISGTYLLGSSSRFITTSASIDARIYPAGRLRSRDLSIETVSGTITTKLHRGDVRLDSVDARFSSKSGSIDAGVTSEWEGRVEVKSVTGSLHVLGDDVKIIEDGRNRLPGMARKIVAEKGRGGKGKIEGESVSGSVSVRFLSM